MKCARRSMRVATRVSPGWMKSRMPPSSGRFSRLVPLPAPVRVTVQPTVSSAVTWAAGFWSLIETLG